MITLKLKDENDTRFGIAPHTRKELPQLFQAPTLEIFKNHSGIANDSCRLYRLCRFCRLRFQNNLKNLQNLAKVHRQGNLRNVHFPHYWND